MFTQFTFFDIGTACIIMYIIIVRTDNHHFQEVKGLTEKLYAYALDQKKPVHRQISSLVLLHIDLRFFMKKMKMKNL